MTLLDKIDAVLASKHLKRADLARMTGYSPSRISKWFAGEGTPSIFQGRKIAQVLGVPLDWLSDEEADLPPPSLEISEDDITVQRMVKQIGSAETIRRLLEWSEPNRVVSDEEKTRLQKENVKRLRPQG